MPVKQVVQDTFEKLGGQVKQTASALADEPVKMVKNLLGELDQAEEESGGGGGQVDPQIQQQLIKRQQIQKLRQFDERRKQEHLAAIRKHGATLKQWDQERRQREMEERQENMEEQKEDQEKQEKKQIKQLERREKTEALSVKRAKTAVEARQGKF